MKMKTLHLSIITGAGIGVIIVVTLMFFFTTTNVPQPHPMTYLKNDTGIVTLENQAYYFETPNYSSDAYFNSPVISFHDVTFTLFPTGFRGGLPTNGCGGQYYWTDAKFSDGTSELLHIFVGSPQCSDPQPPTYFSTHTNPRAGLTFYDGKMKLLVSTNQNMSDYQKARMLAETSLPDLQTVSGYHFLGIIYVTSGGFNTTSGIKSVQVSYQTPSGGTMTITEDPQMTKVLNVTVFEPLRTLPANGQ